MDIPTSDNFEHEFVDVNMKHEGIGNKSSRIDRMRHVSQGRSEKGELKMKRNLWLEDCALVVDAKAQ